MAEEGTPISISKACELAGISRRTHYYKPTRRKAQINEFLAQRVRRVIDAVPYAGYRTVAWLLGENNVTIPKLVTP